MRIWDIQPGYLNRQSLLGEHRELHGIVSILVNKKKGYANHPETLRWVGFGWALRQRHRLLAAEMALRGFTDKSPVRTRARKGVWPTVYIDEPGRQFELLEEKYQNKEAGRLSLPRTAQQLWSQHKYSVMARDVSLYRKLGPIVSKTRPRERFPELSKLLTEALRQQPSAGGLRNALLHMWGHVSDLAGAGRAEVDNWSSGKLLEQIQRHALASEERYLLASTALGELRAWMDPA